MKLTWLGEMNHSKDSSLIAFPDDSVLMAVDYISFGRLPNREMDFENGLFEEWMTATRETEAVARGYEFVATGHGQLGVTLGATTGMLIADLVAGREPAIDLTPYSAARF